MSDFVGAGVYRIESIIDRDVRVALSGGRRPDGTKVLTWKNDTNKNDVFAFTFAGVGKSGKHEYHIINNNSGTYLTYPEGAPEGKQLEGNVLSPLNERTRWNLTALRNRTGQYWISPVANGDRYLNINSGKTDNGTEVWLYKDRNHKSCKFYLAQAFDITGAPNNSPDLPKAA